MLLLPILLYISVFISSVESSAVNVTETLEFVYPFPETTVDYDDLESRSVNVQFTITTTKPRTLTVFIFCDNKLVESTWNKTVNTRIASLEPGDHLLQVYMMDGLVSDDNESENTPSSSSSTTQPSSSSSSSSSSSPIHSMKFRVEKPISETEIDGDAVSKVLVLHPLRRAQNPGQIIFEWSIANADNVQDPRVWVTINGQASVSEIRGETSGSAGIELPYGIHNVTFKLQDGDQFVSETVHQVQIPKIRKISKTGSALVNAGNRDGSDGNPGVAIRYPPAESIFQCHPDLHVVMHYSVLNSPAMTKTTVLIDGYPVQETDAVEVSVNLSGLLPGFHEISVILANNYTETLRTRAPQIRNKIRFGIEFSHEDGPVACSIYLPTPLHLANAGVPEWAMYAKAEKRIMGKGGDDGVLEALFNDIDDGGSIYVEFGAGLGLECVSRFLKEERAWKGQLFDAQYEDPEIYLAKEAPTPATVVDIMKKYHLPANFDLLILPSSCADFHLWQSIGKEYKPRVVLAGYNPRLSPKEDKVVPYDLTLETGAHNGFGDQCERFVGSSAMAMTRLAWSLGYALVHADGRGQRLYFVNFDEAQKCHTKGVDDVEQLMRVVRFYPQRGVDPYDPTLNWAESGLGI